MSRPVKAKEIREAFLSYFGRQGHARVASSQLVPENDPTLLFTNAGMVQFKDVFLGLETRPYSRAVSCQKCVRAGGKHNDLENVGFTERHHTFFEMLGNFSFGDYFKKDAIHFAWDFVTKDLGLPKDRLRVSVFEKDDESAEIWHKQEGLPLDRIVRFGEKDNFWAMGEEGPCGPCSEIFWDQGKEVDGERWLEFWNVVFMQYDRKKDGSLTPLKKPSVDTGMGLERMSTVMQNVQSNYSIDIFIDLIRDTQSLFEKRLKRKIDLTDRDNLCALRVIADHLRATSFLVGDGVMPSNEGRGYVLRRILRRAVRFGHKLGLREAFLGKLYPSLIQSLGDFYPELGDRKDYICNVLEQEELRFFETLDRGIELLEDALKRNSKELSPDTVFKLYDTFGFPFDLTQLIARERGVQIQMTKVEALLGKQQEQSRAAWKGSGAEALPAAVREWKNSITVTPAFYETETETESIVRAHQQSSDGDWIAIDPCPFYAESGGQVGDSGKIVDEAGRSFRVLTCKKLSDSLFALKVDSTTALKVGDTISAVVDDSRRQRIRKHHTATHLLHSALRNTLGTHVHQAGSYLDERYLRFDFAHNKPVSKQELENIEEWVNRVIDENHPVEITWMDQKQAIDQGAMALFGEKYGDRVRVVNVPGLSMELCGGLHVKRSSEIQHVRILKEEGVASGTRRIEACAGEALLQYLLEKEKLLQNIADRFQTPPDQLQSRLEKLLLEKLELERKTKDLEKRLATGSASQTVVECTHQGTKFQLHALDLVSIPALREYADHAREKSRESVHVILSGNNVIVSAHPNIKFHCGDFLKTFVAHWKGRGGGNERTAQGAFNSPVSLKEIETWFKSHA